MVQKCCYYRHYQAGEVNKTEDTENNSQKVKTQRHN